MPTEYKPVKHEPRIALELENTLFHNEPCVAKDASVILDPCWRANSVYLMNGKPKESKWRPFVFSNGIIDHISQDFMCDFETTLSIMAKHGLINFQSNDMGVNVLITDKGADLMRKGVGII